MSLLGVITGLGPILAPQVGGLLLIVANWRFLFWLLTAMAVGLFTAAYLTLDESMPAERSNVVGPRLWLLLLKDRRFLRYALPANLISASVFSYIAGAPFVFIGQLHLSPQRFAWLFGVAVSGHGGFWALAVPLFFYIAAIGFNFANGFTLAGFGGTAVSALYDGSARAMTGVMAGLAVCGVALYRWIKKRDIVIPVQ